MALGSVKVEQLKARYLIVSSINREDEGGIDWLPPFSVHDIELYYSAVLGIRIKKLNIKLI